MNYRNDAVAACNGQNISTGDDAGAGRLDLSLDGVDDVEPS